MTTNEQTPADTMNSAIATVLRAEKAAQKLTYPNLAEATGIPAVSLKRLPRWGARHHGPGACFDRAGVEHDAG